MPNMLYDFTYVSTVDSFVNYIAKKEREGKPVLADICCVSSTNSGLDNMASNTNISTWSFFPHM